MAALGLTACLFPVRVCPSRRKSKGATSAGTVGEEKSDEDGKGSARKLYDPDWWKRRLAPENKYVTCVCCNASVSLAV